MSTGGSLFAVFGGLFGTGTGAGIALLYVMCAVCMLLVGLSGFSVPQLWDVEKIVPDHDAECGESMHSK
ncbi:MULTISPECIES: hypothetical protein [unclassified Anabaena]|uniref:hypothetical protein n=1 Tax=unclassified Anabaena TaxID=2619674 RepID=UPI0039C6242C